MLLATRSRSLYENNVYRQLMKVIGDMKSDINVNEDTESTDKGEPKPLKGDDNPPQDSAEPSTSK